MEALVCTVEEVVERLGGSSRAAERLGVLPSAVSNWKARGLIPADRYLVVNEALRQHGARAADAVFGFSAAPDSAPAESPV